MIFLQQNLDKVYEFGNGKVFLVLYILLIDPLFVKYLKLNYILESNMGIFSYFLNLFCLGNIFDAQRPGAEPPSRLCTYRFSIQ
jgi:hypothetical protein